jgi:hypothetical protein
METSPDQRRGQEVQLIRKPRRARVSGGSLGPIALPVDARPDWADAFLEHTREGGTMAAFCRQDYSPNYVTIYAWMKRSPKLRAEYDEALAISTQQLDEERLDIARERNEHDPEDVNHRRLLLGTINQVLAHRDPRRYGDKKQVEHQGGVALRVVTGLPAGAEDED